MFKVSDAAVLQLLDSAGCWAASEVVRVRQACEPDSDNSLGDWRRPEVSSQSETRTTVTRPGCLDRSRRWRKGCIEDMEGPDINSAA